MNEVVKKLTALVDKNFEIHDEMEAIVAALPNKRDQAEAKRLMVEYAKSILQARELNEGIKNGKAVHPRSVDPADM